MTEHDGLERSSELLPCPFCGGEAFMRSLYKGYIVDAIHTENCPLNCRVLPHSARWCTRSAAAWAWNYRRADA